MNYNPLKYHLLNTLSVILFSFVMAHAINQVTGLTILGDAMSGRNKAGRRHDRQRGASRKTNSFESYKKPILESGFFKVASESDQEGAIPPGKVEDLVLVGTITGPPSITRALILDNTTRLTEIYRLWSTVSGLKIVRIRRTAVYLKAGDDIVKIGLFDKKERNKGKHGSHKYKGSNTVKRVISRAELRQKLRNKLDNLLRGLRVSPYRLNNRISGYRLISVRPYNILYKYGLRSGDIIKRINGRAVSSTQTLMNMLNRMKNEPRITVDINRRGREVTYMLEIKD